MESLREATDQTKLEEAKADLEQNGWQGPPLVSHDGRIITGTYRYAAARALGWDLADLPTVTLEELFTEVGLDMHGVIAEVDYPALDEDEFIEVLKSLPRKVLREYEFAENFNLD